MRHTNDDYIVCVRTFHILFLGGEVNYNLNNDFAHVMARPGWHPIDC
jgi:hypothetical protein